MLWNLSMLQIKLAGKLMKEGYSFLHQFHITYLNIGQNIQFDHDFWIKQDLPILRKCSKLIFYCCWVIKGMQRIEESKGCQSEKAEAIKCNIPIEYMKFKF